MNIIFLDVDGVLNTTSGKDFCFHEMHVGEGQLNSDCLYRLKRIIDKIADCQIVLSTSWRTSEWRIGKLKHYLGTHGIDPDIVIGKTTRLGSSRTEQILTWVEKIQKYK